MTKKQRGYIGGFFDRYKLVILTKGPGDIQSGRNNRISSPCEGIKVGEGIELSVFGGKMVISKIKPSTGNKMSAASFSDEYDLKVGDKFSDQLELTST